MINKADILRNYHNHAIIIKLSNMEESLSGMIVDDSRDDYCIFVRNPDLVEYYETRKESLIQKVYFKDMKTIEYQ